MYWFRPLLCYNSNTGRGPSYNMVVLWSAYYMVSKFCCKWDLIMSLKTISPAYTAISDHV